MTVCKPFQQSQHCDQNEQEANVAVCLITYFTGPFGEIGNIVVVNTERGNRKMQVDTKMRIFQGHDPVYHFFLFPSLSTGLRPRGATLSVRDSLCVLVPACVLS